ncbi:hypothetical protein V6N13_019662 [Hibiscus sabdariffa]
MKGLSSSIFRAWYVPGSVYLILKGNPGTQDVCLGNGLFLLMPLISIGGSLPLLLFVYSLDIGKPKSLERFLTLTYVVIGYVSGG